MSSNNLSGNFSQKQLTEIADAIALLSVLAVPAIHIEQLKVETQASSAIQNQKTFADSTADYEGSNSNQKNKSSLEN